MAEEDLQWRSTFVLAFLGSLIEVLDSLLLLARLDIEIKHEHPILAEIIGNLLLLKTALNLPINKKRTASFSSVKSMSRLSRFWQPVSVPRVTLISMGLCGASIGILGQN